MQEHVEKNKNKGKKRINSISKIGIVLYPEYTIPRAYNLLIMDEKIKTIAVVDQKSHFYGIIVRDKFMEYYEHREVDKEEYGGTLKDVLHNTRKFCVSADETIKRAARQAMSCPEEDCNDAFGVVNDDRYFGTVAIRDLVWALAEL